VKQKIGGWGAYAPLGPILTIGGLTFLMSESNDRLCMHCNSPLLAFSSMKHYMKFFLSKTHFMNLQHTNINKLCASYIA
jgi:hypothetical protein